MTTWQYRLINSKDIPAESRMRGPSQAEVEQFLNGIGAEGWEIVNLDWRDLEGRMAFMGVAKRSVG